MWCGVGANPIKLRVHLQSANVWSLLVTPQHSSSTVDFHSPQASNFEVLRIAKGSKMVDTANHRVSWFICYCITMIVVLVLLIGFWINLMSCIPVLSLHHVTNSEICITMTRWYKVRVRNMWRVRLRCRMLHWIMWGGIPRRGKI